MTIGRIYKIFDNTNDNIYIGSTIKQLNERLKGHEKAYKSYLNCKYHYVTSFEILKNDDYQIVLLEEIEFDVKSELFAREGRYISSLECVNKVIPNRTLKEYKLANIEQKRIYDKQYRLQHREDRRQYKQQYYQLHKKIKKLTINQTFKEIKKIYKLTKSIYQPNVKQIEAFIQIINNKK